MPALPGTVPDVRRALSDLPLPAAVLKDAQLLASELVGNSIRHAGLNRDDRIRIRANLSGGRLRVEVFDQASVTGRSSVAGAVRPGPGAESGWGLYLVDRLATRWGRGHGKHWFELEVDQQAERGSA
jgi:serine/threonine-protein kinase RsbW